MSHIEAIYHHGVFEPLEPVNLREEQRVQLSIQPASGQPPESWIRQVQAIQAAILQRQGILPDCASEIAVDRLR